MFYKESKEKRKSTCDLPVRFKRREDGLSVQGDRMYFFFFLLIPYKCFVCWISFGMAHALSRADVGSQRIVDDMGREFDVLWVMEGYRHCARLSLFWKIIGNITKFLARIEGRLDNALSFIIAFCQLHLL